MKNPLRSLVIAVGLALGVVPSLPAQVLTKPAISLELAKKIAAKAAAEAAKNQWNMAIAIVDEGGNLIYLEKMDGTQIVSIDVAQHKAKTSLRFRRPTKGFEEAIAGGRTALLALPGIVPLEGGVPLVVDGAYIGAIGVSGAKSSEDGLVAEAGASVLRTAK